MTILCQQGCLISREGFRPRPKVVTFIGKGPYRDDNGLLSLRPPPKNGVWDGLRWAVELALQTGSELGELVSKGSDETHMSASPMPRHSSIFSSAYKRESGGAA